MTILFQVCTTDEFVSDLGGVGLCFETGQAADTSSFSRVLGSTMAMLCQLGMFDSSYQVSSAKSASADWAEIGTETGTTKTHCKFRLNQRILLPTQESGKVFAWAPNKGLENFEYSRAGELIATVTHKDGKVEALAVDYDSYLLFPKVAHLWRSGQPVGWLAKEM